MRFYLRNDFNDRPGAFYICWTDNGRPRRLSCRTRDPEAAQKALARHILEHERPRDQLAADVTVTAVMLRYYQHHARKLASADTAKCTLAHVTRFLPMMTVAELDKHAQRQFMANLRGLGIADNTVDRRIGVLQAALNWAHDQGQLAAAPPQKLLRPGGTDGPGQRPATVGELAALFSKATHEHRRRFLMLAIGTAGRPGALLDLTWSRVDTQTQTVDLHEPTRRKTKKLRPRVPMASTLARFLEERRSVGAVIKWRGRPLKGHRTAFEKLAEEAGVTVGAYALRKTCATTLRREGVNRWDVAAMLGHKLSGETDRYAYFEPGFMAAVKAAIDGLYRAISEAWPENSANWLEPYLPAVGSAAEPKDPWQSLRAANDGNY